ncbi:MAG: FtsX-like permease family protein [Pseudomonadota bacterium]|nr:FtsX-like permease family protein [Pseudomonadota bacterium]
MLTWQIFKGFLFSTRAGALVRTIARLCIVGIGIGVFALILINSVMNGFNQAIHDRHLKVEPHIVVWFDKNFGESQQEKVTNEISEDPDVEVSYFEKQDVLVRTTDGNHSGAVAVGFEEAALEKILKGVEGIERVDLRTNEIYIGRDLAYSLGVFTDDLLVIVAPETLLLPAGEVPKFEQVRVKGVISTRVAEVDAQKIFYVRKKSLARFQDSPSFSSGLQVQLKDPMNFENKAGELKARGFKVETWVDRNSTMFFALKVEKAIIAGFLGLSTIISSFSIVTVLVLLFAQKRREFGVLMALGLSTLRIRRIFSGVGLLLSGLGLGGGILLGLAFALALEKWPLDILPKDIYYDSRITAKVNFVFVGIVIVGAVLLSLICTWLATLQIIKSNPSEALRSKVKISV